MITRKVLIDKVYYSNASIVSGEIKLSKSIVMQYVLEFQDMFKYQINFNEKESNFRDIFVCIDDTFRNLKVENKCKKFKFRVINIYQDRTHFGFTNQVKICLIFKTNSNQNQQLETEKVIQNTLKNTMILIIINMKLQCVLMV